ncbi:nitrile hydratase subunit beta [Halobaculum gomorrense]|uniref:nitrile hydratase n=1 Tax=Halobaculum gomorrense TaxID=43928 RepID=A0A1M5MXH1_9EURY|nr:nitrile hydratase subunit beta [Halobaculum gomorrense]SHG81915.1 nitrile hydratase [Halobaculum gomorrense]
MDGIHDLGGMDSFRDLPPDQPDDASPFHHEWEGVVQSLYIAGLGSDSFELDRFRYTLEGDDHERYLTVPYYERWLGALETLFVEAGVVDAAELRERAEAFAAGEAEVPDMEDPDRLPTLLEGVREKYLSRRGDGDPAFAVGDRVRVAKRHPVGHTRCPRYVRGAEGEIVADRGAHVYPDENARKEGDDERAEQLYNVRFDAEELWGEDCTDANGLHTELWEPYLVDPADG